MRRTRSPQILPFRNPPPVSTNTAFSFYLCSRRMQTGRHILFVRFTVFFMLTMFSVRVPVSFYVPERSSIACSSTLQPAVMCSGLASSISLWLMPSLQGMKIMPLLARRAM